MAQGHDGRCSKEHLIRNQRLKKTRYDTAKYNRLINRALHRGGGNYITENYPTLYPTFSTRKILTAGDSIGNYKEVTPAQKTTIESDVAKLIEAGNGVRTEMTPYFEASGAVFIDKTGYYSYHDIKDLTEEDMRLIFAAGVPVIGSYQASSVLKHRIFLQVGNITGQIPFQGDIDCFCYGNLKLETFMYFRNYIIVNGALRRSFASNPKLRVIGHGDEYINAAKYLLYQPSGPQETFSGLPLLEHVYIKKLRSDIQFRDSPLLDYDSVRYMIDNAANTTAITIYVHANVMAKLTGGVKVFALDNRYDKAQWVKSTTVDNMEGYTPLVDSGLENGDYVVVHGTPTNDPNPYYFLGVVVGHRTDNAPQIKTLFGVQAEFDPSEYSDTQWHQILTDAAEKQITFATLT